MKTETSIIIANYNGKELTSSLINSIKRSSYKLCEIIVVDNNSSDGSQDYLMKKWKDIKMVKNSKNLGYVGINSALKYCRGKYIMFLNNDMELDRDCIKNMVKNIKSDKDAVMIAPRLVNFYDKSIMSGGTWVSRAFYSGHINGNSKNKTMEIPYLGVGLIRKDFVDMFGYLFDPDYFIYAEDLDLGLRIRLAGKKVIFEPKAAMHHMHSVAMQKKSKAFAAFLMERNLLITFFKIMSAGSVFAYSPYVLFARLMAIAKDIITLRFNVAFARVRAVAHILMNFNSILKKRASTQNFRKMDDNYILEVFSEKYIFKPRFIV